MSEKHQAFDLACPPPPATIRGSRKHIMMDGELFDDAAPRLDITTMPQIKAGEDEVGRA